MASKCGLDTIADLLILSRQHVCRLVKEGVLPRDDRGEYDGVDCVQAYIKYLRNINSAQDFSLSEVRRQDVLESSLLKKKKREILDGKYVLIEIAAKVLERVVLPFRAARLAFPTKVAPLLERRSKKDIQEILTKIEHRELTELAGLDVAHFVAELEAQAGGSTAAPERKRVGRRKAKAKSRK